VSEADSAHTPFREARRGCIEDRRADLFGSGHIATSAAQ